MKKYKVIALSALIAAGFTSCDLTEKTYFLLREGHLF